MVESSSPRARVVLDLSPEELDVFLLVLRRVGGARGGPLASAICHALTKLPRYEARKDQDLRLLLDWERTQAAVGDIEINHPNPEPS